MDAAPDASFGTLDLDEGMIELIKPELAPGERLLWASRSDERAKQRRPRSKVSLLIWAVGLLALGVVGIFASRSLLTNQIGEALLLFAVISCILGALFLVATIAARFPATDLPGRTMTRLYAITDRRAIFWSPGSDVDSVEVFTLPRGKIRSDGIRRVQYPDGSGDLFLRNSHRAPGGFLGVPEVRLVEDLVRSHLVDPAADSIDP